MSLSTPAIRRTSTRHWPTATLLAAIISPLAGVVSVMGGELPFTERTISNSLNAAVSVFAIDLDGDGDMDALSASDRDDKIAWYENDGGSPPAFVEHVISTGADFASSVFAVDLDGDGDIDVLSASLQDDKIAWYESDGGSPPVFAERVISTVADFARSVFAIDVDGDGDVDVLSASELDDKIAWYENDGGSPPTFTEQIISTSALSAFSVYAADIDGDGDTDVLSASRQLGVIAWYESTGGANPVFTERVISTTAGQASSVFAADVDGDGDIDVLSAARSNDKIAWYENDGGSPPIFGERVISTTASGARSVFATDVDGDGNMDILSASEFDEKIAWYQSDGGSPPTFTERVISLAANGAVSVFAADVDGDGDTDVFSASLGGGLGRSPSKVTWYENTPAPEPVPFIKHLISASVDGARSVFAIDVDGDGYTDVLSASLVDDNIAWYESDGGSPPVFSEQVISTIADGAQCVFATDLDGDSDTDVLSASTASSAPGGASKFAWYENTGGSPLIFTERAISSSFDHAWSIFAIDIDGDGNTDIVSASTNVIAWHESNGGSPPSFTERPISTSAIQAHSVFALDLDGDGDTDVLSASSGFSKIAWYENDGSLPPAFVERIVSTNAEGASSVFAADLDGDGDVDILSASESDDKIAWYENDGGSPPTFAERTISITADGASSVFALDVDGDGDTDILSSSFFDDKIAWYENDGRSPPTFAERAISTTEDGALSVFAIDIDGDGDTDVLSASNLDDTIMWYENVTPRCGDGLVDPNELCDDGGESSLCDADCTVVECGDDTLNATAGEQCDGASDSACPGACLSDCTCGPFCGDGACGLGEDSCNCPSDCGTPPSNESLGAMCSDGLDNDCDGLTDSADSDCDVGIPTVSAWGLVVMSLLLVAGLKIKFGRRRLQRS